ncbi:unnamed protein product [Rotaria magnacalcarata]|nr:unnamed protein product [Rotaria magnacalcarata]
MMLLLILLVSKSNANQFKSDSMCSITRETYLVHLLLEAHDAMSFYYNSIDDILNVSSVFSSNDQLKQIQDNLRDKIICEYRSVLNVYSHEWTPINHIKRLEFALTTYPSTPSFTHNYQSIFVVQILNEWMKRIDSVIIKLRTENFLIVKAS